MKTRNSRRTRGSPKQESHNPERGLWGFLPSPEWDSPGRQYCVTRAPSNYTHLHLTFSRFPPGKRKWRQRRKGRQRNVGDPSFHILPYRSGLRVQSSWTGRGLWVRKGFRLLRQRRLNTELSQIDILIRTDQDSPRLEGKS